VTARRAADGCVYADTIQPICAGASTSGAACALGPAALTLEDTDGAMRRGHAADLHGRLLSHGRGSADGE
jgi:hypothetical protein